MNAKISFKKLYWSNGLLKCFFRKQAIATLEDLIERSEGNLNDIVNHLDDVTEDMDIDEFEELLYSYGTETLAEQFNLTLTEDDVDAYDD
jgi:hypothetical protein